MNEVNKTLYIPLYGKAKVSRQAIILNDPYAEGIWKEEEFPIHGKSRFPLYGKAKVSRQGIILNDPCAEEIWKEEEFPIHGKSRSKWLAYNMAMRARVFDDWTDILLQQNEDALVLHIGCGLDSRCVRIKSSRSEWIDCDLPDVIEIRKKHFQENATYHMKALDASRPEQIESLPDCDAAIVVLEGLSMYLTNSEVHRLLQALDKKYRMLHILMDVYTDFGVKASNYKNPVKDVGVYKLYGINDIDSIISGLRIRFVKEHSFTPKALVNELAPLERLLFKMLFSGKIYRKIYRLYELEA